jgi:low affinity Fe/Cu permease
MTKIFSRKFDRFSEWIADSLGKPIAFAAAVSSVLIWSGFGPFTHYSQTWQLIINTGTTIATFLMVFLLQNTQNRDTQEIKDVLKEIRKDQRTLLNVQRKLNERITTIEYELDKKKTDA